VDLKSKTKYHLRHIGSLHEKAQDYEAMLKEMEYLIHGKSAERVRDLLQKVRRLKC
jgi:hypothetical protein